MFDQLSLLDIPNATSSLESVDGASQPGSPASLTIIRSGQDRAPASLTPMQALAQGMTTREPFGGRSAGSSSSAVLQSSLESRLRARLGVDGSPEYVLTWKHWDMQWGGADLCSAGVGAPNIRPRLYWVGHADNKGPQGHRGSIGKRNQEGREAKGRHGAPAGFWSSFEVVTDVHGKRRRIESGVKPLAYGVPKRVGKLRGYGNAINPQLGAQFLSAYLEATA